jgi:formylglycine-generating enzyme required for sulfatase activity/serine/threonine protein kinase/predicted esterase
VTEQAIFCAALDIDDPAARAAYLDEACAKNGALRQQVESLLSAHQRSGEFLDRPAAEQIVADQAPHEDATASLPDAGAEEANDLGFLEPPTRADSLGRLGHYEILEVLGRGGFGVVLKAFDDALHRVVAIKVMAPNLAVTSPARKRFSREARTAAGIRDENIVHIYDVQDEPIPYLVMEYIDGETLQQRLDRTGPLDVLEAVRLGRHIASGLAAAHEKGFFHRDIKPSNILLESGATQRVMITDFGLARAADDASVTKSGVIVGTPLYMSPEQAQGEAIDQRTDLFSLGSVLYVTCSGRPPFRASSTLAVLKRVAEDEPRPIREIIPEVPQWLCDIISRLHAKKPEERFASAREVADVLAHCVTQLEQNGAVTNAGLDLSAGRSRTVKRHPALSALPGRLSSVLTRRKWIAAAATLMLVSLAAAVYFRQRGENDRSGAAPTEREAVIDPARFAPEQEACATKLDVPVELENSIGMKLVLIPPGRFIMGSKADELGRENHEGPEHEVVLTRPFYMAIHDVTVGQFAAFVKEANYQTEPEKNGGAIGLFPDSPSPRSDPRVNWKDPLFEQGDDHPVVCVSWNDARAFCDWLSAREGKHYALPTEAQWEYACRAGSRSTFSFGNDDQELSQHAWHLENADLRTHPVGQKKPNAWGLYDMHGLIWQWTADWYASHYYREALRDDPPGPIFGAVPVQRGGSWFHGPQLCRSAARRAPSWAPPSAAASSMGFRVVLIGDMKASPGSKKSDALPARDGTTGFVKKKYQDTDGSEHDYVVFVPRGYKSETKYPVILFLHGAGQNKGTSSSPVDVGIGPAIKKQEMTFPFITVIPQSARHWQAGSPDADRALGILDKVCSELNVDTDRIYLTGLSTGGSGTWSLAARYPEKWAAIAPLCGSGDEKSAERIKSIPCWCFHGKWDAVMPLRYSRNMIAALKAAGGTPRYTEYLKAGHRCWFEAYDNPELYEFLLANKRQGSNR